MPAITSLLLATAVAGTATSGYGLFSQHQGSKQSQAGYQTQQAAAQQAAVYNKNILNDELQQENVRRQAMELDAKRNSLQVVRQSQQARAMAIASATSQGAGFFGNNQASSGLFGGLGQISGDTNFNLLGINQNLQAGRKMFDINADINQQKIGLAGTQSQMAQGQGQVSMGQGTSAMGSGFMSLGGSMVSAASTFANLSGTYFGGSASGANSGINQGVAGGGYYGTNGSIYPGPGRYGR